MQLSFFLRSASILISDSTFLGNYNTSGQAIYSDNSIITTINCLFEGNTGRQGGVISAMSGTALTLIGNTFTRNRANVSGGAIYAARSSIVISGAMPTIFSKNSVKYHKETTDCRIRDSCNGGYRGSGGAIRMSDIGKLTIKATIFFSYNQAVCGGAIDLAHTTVKIYDTVMITFTNNKACYGGALNVNFGDILFQGTTTFSNNTAIIHGGAMKMNYFYLAAFNGTTTFSNNSADAGGAISIDDDVKLGKLIFAGRTVFSNNIANTIGGAINMLHFLQSIIYGTVIFTNNSANTGGAINVISTKLSINRKGTVIFINNTAYFGGGMYIESGELSFNGTTTFTNNIALDDGGALYALNTDITMENITTFLFNSATNGGAMYFGSGTSLVLNGSALNTSYNRALNYGGVIYNNDDTVTSLQSKYAGEKKQYPLLPYCFIKLKETASIHSYLNSYCWKRWQFSLWRIIRQM